MITLNLTDEAYEIIQELIRLEKECLHDMIGSEDEEPDDQQRLETLNNISFP